MAITIQTHRSISALDPMDDKVVVSAIFEDYPVLVKNQLNNEIMERIATRYVEENYEKVVDVLGVSTMADAIAEMVRQKVTILLSEPKQDRTQEDERTMKLISGICPECGEHFKHNTDWNYFPALNPEKAETLREHGVNLSTGHKMGCALGGTK